MVAEILPELEAEDAEDAEEETVEAAWDIEEPVEDPEEDVAEDEPVVDEESARP